MGTDGLLGGRYRLDRVVGHGGMATVFAAHDIVLDRIVAVKLLQRRRDPTGVIQERFRREAFAAAKIVHPNVVTVHDVGESDDGRPFIVMDFVEGRSLAALAADGPLDSERAAMLGLGIALALGAAHALGIVHRDVKPANILVDDGGIPHLTDFGLARAADAADANLTEPGTLLGTANYIAPEQARYGTGSAQADLYALGAVLYHLLAGEPPFVGEGPIDTALRHVEEDPVALTLRVPGVDPDLAALVDALLVRDPASRPHDAGAVAERLFDIVARLRSQRTSGESLATPDLHLVPPTFVAGVAPEIPPPNSSRLPATDWTTPER